MNNESELIPGLFVVAMTHECKHCNQPIGYCEGCQQWESQDSSMFCHIEEDAPSEHEPLDPLTKLVRDYGATT